MSLNVSNVGYHPSFRASTQGTQSVPNVHGSSTISRANKLSNRLGIAGWTLLTVAFIGSVVYGLSDAFSKNDSNRHKNEIVYRDENVIGAQINVCK